MVTTLTISEALKQELVRIKTDNEFKSLNETIEHLIRNPRASRRPIEGYDDTLTEPVKVTEFTRSAVQRERDRGNYNDYEAVLRNVAGVEPREVGEGPIEVRPLSD